MHFSMLFYGLKDVNPEDFVFKSAREDWNPLVVFLSRSPLFHQNGNTIVFSYAYSKEKDESPFSPLDALLGTVNWRATQQGASALVFVDLSRLFYDTLSLFRSTEGDRAGQFAFSLTRAFVNYAIGQARTLGIPIFFHAEERKDFRKNPVTGEKEERLVPALGRKTLEVILPVFNFVAYTTWHEGRIMLFFKTRTGKALVKDPLGKLVGEVADLGLISSKITSLLEERSHAY